MKEQDILGSEDLSKTAWETPSIFELPMDQTQGLLPTDFSGLLELGGSL